MATYEEAADPEFLRRLGSYVRRRVPSAHDADDIVQDALVKLVDKGASVAPGAARAWLFTVVRRQIQDRWRSKRPAALASAEPAAPPPDEENEAIAYLVRCMEPMLASLPENDREIILRIDVRGEGQSAVARELGMPPSSFKSRVQRARRRLRAILEACCSVERDRRGTPVGYARRTERPCPCPEPADRNSQVRSGCGGLQAATPSAGNASAPAPPAPAGRRGRRLARVRMGIGPVVRANVVHSLLSKPGSRISSGGRQPSPIDENAPGESNLFP